MATVNSKKKGINASILPMSRLFVPKIEKPNENAIIFEVNSSIPEHIARQDDYLLCVKCSAVSLSNGDKIMENGRNTRFFRYFKDNDVTMLLNEDSKKEHIRILSDEDLNGFYKIMWIIRAA